MFLVGGRVVRIDTVHNLLQPERGRQVLLVSVARAAASWSEPLALDFAALGTFCVVLFLLSVRNIHRRWIA